MADNPAEKLYSPVSKTAPFPSDKLLSVKLAPANVQLRPTLTITRPPEPDVGRVSPPYPTGLMVCRVSRGSRENDIIIVPSNFSQSGLDELACSPGHSNPGFTM